LTFQIDEKRLELLAELVPKLSSLGVLINPDFPIAEKQRTDILAAAARAGMQANIAFAQSTTKFPRAFAALTGRRVDALLVAANPFFNSRRAELVQLAAQHKLPTIYEFREFPMAGGLISYGIDVVEVYRQAAQYTARILKGARPAELPVLQPTKFQLVINLKTAKVLGLTLPLTLQASADEVIE
jgi:putative ABC transport system substrate-binding protein